MAPATASAIASLLRPGLVVGQAVGDGAVGAEDRCDGHEAESEG